MPAAWGAGWLTKAPSPRPVLTAYSNLKASSFAKEPLRSYDIPQKSNIGRQYTYRRPEPHTLFTNTPRNS